MEQSDIRESPPRISLPLNPGYGTGDELRAIAAVTQ
jgi:hypothetical protein